VFRNFISREPGAQFPPEKGRYHLYVSYACPWVSQILKNSDLEASSNLQ
jgi:Predicted glutathione S-transferase